MSFELKEPKPFPLNSLQAFLIPDQLLSVKMFFAESLETLELKVNDWVTRTKSVIAVPGVISVVDGMFYITLSYVLASEGVVDGSV